MVEVYWMIWMMLHDPKIGNDTVDGRNPAPPGMYKTCKSWEKLLINILSTGAGVLPSTVSLISAISS